MKRRAVAVAIVCVLASRGAFGQTYLGGRLGATHVDIDCEGTISCDKSGSGWEVFGGYLLAPWISVEFGYSQWRSVKQHRLSIAGDVAFDLKTRGPTVGIALFHRLGPQWSACARAGAIYQRVDLVRNIVEHDAVEQYTERHTNPYLGLALAYQLTRGMSIDFAVDVTRVKYSERFFGREIYRDHSVAARRFGVGLSQQF